MSRVGSAHAPTLPPSRRKHRESEVWQQRFWEYTLRSEVELQMSGVGSAHAPTTHNQHLILGTLNASAKSSVECPTIAVPIFLEALFF
ncbi:hypothetical protein PN498_13100 [Oscillatoria sp. CS-180]|uniref:hypothetical protein n=1 Tax=Oscillatoria sp. CS-180 TaxID=3021720 RepID=UPI00232C6B88|nr:hypothetical protein [Oscillatoria sp. CS-180]MDB9526930.1 hypothetical protein [Oscillatoria sp. CS-180]